MSKTDRRHCRSGRYRRKADIQRLRVGIRFRGQSRHRSSPPVVAALAHSLARSELAWHEFDGNLAIVFGAADDAAISRQHQCENLGDIAARADRQPGSALGDIVNDAGEMARLTGDFDMRGKMDLVPRRPAHVGTEQTCWKDAH
jgi:hypothetical protein